MKVIGRIGRWISAVLCAALCAGQAVAAEPSGHFVGMESGAAAVVREFSAGLAAGDAEKVKGLLAPELIVYEGGGVERSAGEYVSHHLEADIEFLRGLKVELLEHQVWVVGDLAYSIARTSMKGKYHDRDIDRESMETIVLRQVDGAWKIVHIHWS